MPTTSLFFRLTYCEVLHVHVQGPAIRDAELLVWVGDFNYRINGISRFDIIEKSRRGDLRELVLAVRSVAFA